MARKEEMEITINEHGEVSLHVCGINGQGCLKLTADIEQALGVVLQREKTPEYYKQSEQATNKVCIGE